MLTPNNTSLHAETLTQVVVNTISKALLRISEPNPLVIVDVIFFVSSNYLWLTKIMIKSSGNHIPT